MPLENIMSKKQKTNKASDKRINSRLQETPIAIVGMASVFAESKNLSQFWDTIVNSVNGIQDVPEDRWAIDDYYSADKKEADKSYCKRGGFLPEVDFDPMEFGLPPNLLELTDITQLMALVVARDVLADAGISDESSFDRDKMGITLGVGGGQKQGGQLMSRLQGPVLEKVLKASGVNDNDADVIVDKFKKAYIPWEENSFPGMLGNVIAGRIANRFNFGGTNCVVDAACAGSLAAIKMAVSDLLEYRSDMMLSGGICCDNSPFMYMSFSKTPAFTDGDCIRPFDDKSNGMMIGEGVGMIALKRLEDAERDGDRIYSVIKGIGSSSDGKFKSIYAPRPEGQLKALKRAYDDAGFDPKTCGLIEAHGTGTKAGDAAEFRGLELLFSEGNDLKQHVALGSVKSQVGHTKAAAGTAGLIKASLALHHKVLPATINVDKPNENLDIENTPLYINSETRPWMQRADGVKRQAGISSFGFGGTNFHFVLEEYTQRQHGAYRLNEVPQSILINADAKAELIEVVKGNITALSVDAELQPYAFNQLILSFPIKKLTSEQSRCGFVAKNAAEALQCLQQILNHLSTDDSTEWSKPTGIYYREAGMETNGKVVALFSGQGSQYLNMGRDLVSNFPSMMSSQTAMDQQFHKAGKNSLSDILYPIPVFDKQKRSLQELELRLTQNAQPAIGCFSAGLFNTFKQAGFKADFAAGHSFGELTALWAAEVLSEVDYMKLAMARGQAMSAPDDVSIDTGTMAAVIGDVEDIEAHIDGMKDVTIANYNANNQAVIAGPTEAIAAASAELIEHGLKVIELPVSAAFHTPLVEHAQKPFAEAIEKATFNQPTIAVYSNATGEAHSDDQASIKVALKEHILQSVQFSKEINNLYDAGGRVFVEFGPKNVLTRLVDNILDGKADVITVATNNNAKKSSDLQLRLAAIELAVLGLELDNIDPYSAIKRPTVAPKKSPLAMKLSGASYVSPKTKKAFDDGLTDGFKITNTASQPVVKEVIKEVIKEVVVEKVVEKIVYVDSAGVPLKNQPQTKAQFKTDNSQLTSANIENSVEQFVKHQSQLLEVHQAYLEGPNEYAETFKSVLAAQAGQQKLPEGLDKTLAMYHDFQTETLRVHETYLNNQTDNMQQMLSNVSGAQTFSKSTGSFSVAQETMSQKAAVNVDIQQQLKATHQTIQSSQQQAAKVQAATKIIEKTASVNQLKEIQNIMLSVVADKTGYPTEMLELSMDMEADLGIDSIKRVEILGAVQDQLTDLPELDAEKLSQMRTLEEIVTYMNEVVAINVPVANDAINMAPSSQVTVSVNSKEIENVMLSVVADKTGYPTEMLELSMDMEADLGIDSIKRVEILGAVQDQTADLPELDAEQLSQMRTLSEIVTYMNDVASINSPSLNNVSSSQVDTTMIENTMLAVVADKTGYPTEMLELSMDMEADLGIDSIKRVEILGAVQDQIPNLPELDAEQLSQMRTLAEIVTYMNEVASVSVDTTSTASVSETSVATSAVQSVSLDPQLIEHTMLAVVADKTGYPTEMLELSMDMEADLGIDSIKRVEILGAVQDQIPNLPELDAEQLSQMRTLSEIVSYMNEVALVSNESVSNNVVSTSTINNAISTAVIDIETIEQTMLNVVADKTGYPADMLELNMDMEADLGIDSIKRVEILGAVQDDITNLPELDAEQLSQMRTLAEIVNYMNVVASAIKTEVTQQPAAQITHSTPTMQEEEDTSSVNTQVTDAETIEMTMLAVVADKTGYPTDMLELSMDMEADLGIDSIKRVEILGAVQDIITDLPELDAEHLSQMRTLAEIVSYMHDVATLDARSVQENNVEPVLKPVEKLINFDAQTIQETMIEVVADKTGYPTEMLELSMDMEADLGIDSIKRVEILGAVQDIITDLPELDAELLSQMRTLDEIVNYMNDVLVSSGDALETIILSDNQQATSSLEDAEAQNAQENQEESTQVEPITSLPSTPEPLTPNPFIPAPSATVAIKQLAPLECVDPRVDNKNVLIVNDGTGATVRIANNMAQLGWTVVVISPTWVESITGKQFSEDVTDVSMSDVSELELSDILNIQNEWQSIIYLHPKSEVTGIQFESVYKKGLQLAFLLAKMGKLNEINNDVRASYLVLTRQGGDFSTDKIEKKSDLVQGGLAGLVKTLSHEWPNVFCRIVDVPSRYAADKVANIVVNELNDKKIAPVEVGYNSNGRLTLTAKSTDSYALEPVAHLDQDAVFLVSGGAKGVTAHCVIELAQQHQCKFILLGRSEYRAEEASWSLHHSTEDALKKAAMQHLLESGKKPSPKLINALVYPVLANREISNTLQQIESNGGGAQYISADVCDADNLKTAIEPICELWGPVTSIIHGAGVLADKHIEQKTLLEFDQVYNTKIMGLDALLACCNANKLKHLVVFSSAAGFYGNPGQSDYAIANEILNKSAYRFKALHPNTQVLSFNWGPWDGGMVTPELKRMFDERGVYIIPIESGVKLLAAELAANTNRCVQIVVGTDMSGKDNDSQEPLETLQTKPLTNSTVKVFDTNNSLLLADHQIGEHQVLPTVCSMAWMKNVCKDLYPGYHYQGLEEFKIFKGIVFDGQQAKQFLIETKLIQDTEQLLCVEVLISSEKVKGMPFFHYRGLVYLTKNKPKSENYTELLPVILKTESDEVNSLYSDGSLFHGKTFQSIKNIHQMDENGLLVECVIDQSVLKSQGEFMLHESNVIANDIVYQAMLIWTSKLLGQGSLPTSTDSWEVFREVQINEYFFVKLLITKRVGQRVIGDLLIIDKNKKILSKITAAEVTVSPTLSELFKANA